LIVMRTEDAGGVDSYLGDTGGGSVPQGTSSHRSPRVKSRLLRDDNAEEAMAKAPQATAASQHILFSALFRGDLKLLDCLNNPMGHVVPDSQGDHVGKIQKALVALGAGLIDPMELMEKKYGRTTIAAVVAFKTKWRIINTAYEDTVDPIVGQWTIKRLDRQYWLWVEQGQPSNPPILSGYVSMTDLGQPHDHTKCPKCHSWCGPDDRVIHRETPIYPKGTGRKINLGGEGETQYLGFEDFVTTPKAYRTGPWRPLTSTLPNECASDICIRASPFFLSTGLAIWHKGQQGCRFTYATSTEYEDANVSRFLTTMGQPLADLLYPDEDGDPRTIHVSVISCDKTKGQWPFGLLHNDLG
jgi:hypothetical protein